ncbi:prepilin peptidase [Cohnella sp. CFH 77786]|uniref:A24 family peptidase n=1 Tax=Cohnella sp. CFH 77786 TaxID=2662265 RepID=UPI001C608B8F|nr:A24 family peptidase [Cohnella sp. CFH 77786]MBW5447078.1 prepilin peptidase [Cohnella sp. CFH 77786]
METWIAAIAFVLTAAGCWTDLRRMRIPNVLTASFAVGGFIFHSAWDGWTGIIEALSGGAAGALPLLLLYRFGGIGAGDVKWFGALGIWAGAVAALQLLAYSILLAGCLSVLLLSLRLPLLRRWGKRLPWPWGRHPAEPGKGASFPFMLAVAPGYLCLLFGLDGFGM